MKGIRSGGIFSDQQKLDMVSFLPKQVREINVKNRGITDKEKD